MSQALQQFEWVQPPHQLRSHQSMERILDAAEAVIGEKGFQSATVAEIVSRAQSSVGVFYSRFKDKDSLLQLLHERFRDEALATADAALDADRWEGASISEMLSTLIPFLVRIYRERAGLISAFIVRAAVDEQFAERSISMFRHISEHLCTLLLSRYDEIRHPQPVLAVEFGYRLVVSTLDMETMLRTNGTLSGSLTARELSEQLVRAYASFLGIDPDRDSQLDGPLIG